MTHILKNRIFNSNLYCHRKRSICNNIDRQKICVKKIAITIDSSPSSDYLVALGLIIVTFWLFYYYCYRLPVVVNEQQVVHVLNQGNPIDPQPPGLENHSSQGLSKILGFLGSVLGNVPPWGWFLVLIFLALLIYWLKKMQS